MDHKLNARMINPDCLNFYDGDKYLGLNVGEDPTNGPDTSDFFVVRASGPNVKLELKKCYGIPDDFWDTGDASCVSAKSYECMSGAFADIQEILEQHTPE